MIIILYQKRTILSLYKIYIDKLLDKETYSVEFIKNEIYNSTINTISVHKENVILFTFPTKVSYWKIVNNKGLVFQKNLPFFKYADMYEFATNEQTGHVIEAINESFLFIIMQQISNPSKKLLFCFQILTNKHNTLQSIIPLDDSLSKFENSLFVEGNKYGTDILLYVFYGDKKYHLISFVPYNQMTETDDIKTGNLFLPKECLDNNEFQELRSRNPKCIDLYKNRNVSLEIYPVSLGDELIIKKENHTMYYSVNCQNIGFKIDKVQDDSIDLLLTPENGIAKISLLDYFVGFNNSYVIEHTNTKEEPRILFDYSFSENSASTVILESVKTDSVVFYSFEYMDKYLLLFFEGKERTLQVYKIDEDIRKLEKEYNHFELFEDCIIDHISYKKINDLYNFLILSCEDPSNEIRAAYIVKIFSIISITDDQILLRFVDDTMVAHKVLESDIISTLNDQNSYYIIFHSKSQEEFNSVIYFVTMNCTWNICEFDNYRALSADKLGLTSFSSNSFLFVPNHPLFIVSVDNIGLVVINLHSWRVIETLKIRDFIPLSNDDFTIYRITVLNENSIRVFIFNYGSFSFLWKGIKQVFNPINSEEISININSYSKYEDVSSIFESLTIDDIVLETSYEIDTNFISNSNSGYTQIIYYQESENLYTAYVRVYNLYNKDKSKVLSEFTAKFRYIENYFTIFNKE